MLVERYHRLCGQRRPNFICYSPTIHADPRIILDLIGTPLNDKRWYWNYAVVGIAPLNAEQPTPQGNGLYPASQGTVWRLWTRVVGGKNAGYFGKNTTRYDYSTYLDGWLVELESSEAAENAPALAFTVYYHLQPRGDGWRVRMDTFFMAFPPLRPLLSVAYKPVMQKSFADMKRVAESINEAPVHAS